MTLDNEVLLSLAKLRKWRHLELAQSALNRSFSIQSWGHIASRTDPCPVGATHDAPAVTPIRPLDRSGSAGGMDYGQLLWAWLAKCINLCSAPERAHPLVPYTIACILDAGGWALSYRFGKSFIKLLRGLFKSLPLIERAAKVGDSGRFAREAIRLRIERLVGMERGEPRRVFAEATNVRPVAWCSIPSARGGTLGNQYGDQGDSDDEYQ